MKILMLNYEFPPLGGGSSPVTLQLGRELVRMGHQVDAVTMAGKGLPRRETVEGIKVLRLPALRFRREKCTTPEMTTFLLSALARLPGIVRRGGYDIDHAHFIFPTGPAALWARKRTGLPYLVTSHGSDVPGYNPDRFGLQHKLLAPLWKAVVRGAELVTTPSADHADLVRKHAPWARVEPVPNGIDPDEFRADRPRKKVILGAGRLFPRKNYALLLEALEGIPEGWEVVLAGEGPERPRLEALAREKKIPLTVTGWLDRKSQRLKDLYETSSIFALPSLKESFGMVVAEAMAAGMAVVTTSGGGPAEVAGEAGLLVPPGDKQALREALFRLMQDQTLRRTLATKARARALQEFAWPAVARRFLALYREITEKTPSPP